MRGWVEEWLLIISESDPGWPVCNLDTTLTPSVCSDVLSKSKKRYSFLVLSLIKQRAMKARGAAVDRIKSNGQL